MVWTLLARQFCSDTTIVLALVGSRGACGISFEEYPSDRWKEHYAMPMLLVAFKNARWHAKATEK